MYKTLEILKHSIAWLIILVIINSLPWFWQGFESTNGTFLIPSLYGTAFNIFVVYFNALYLYNIKKASPVWYWLMVFVLIMVTSIIEGGFDYYYAKKIELLDTIFEQAKKYQKEEGGLLGSKIKIELYVYIYQYFLNNFLVHLVFWFLSFSYILPMQNMKNDRLKKELEKEKLRAEIKILKAQINPHSLFNGINSIYYLIDKDKEKAKDVLVRFSELLRYQIYECSVDKISLAKEVLFLENYFDLEKTRKKADLEIEFTYNIHETEHLKIAPILFIAFVENAFKYVSSYPEKKKNIIKCEIQIHDKKLLFTIVNSVDEDIKKEICPSKNGVGIRNVKERLALLYPERHSLDITHQFKTFTVTLIINLDE